VAAVVTACRTARDLVGGVERRRAVESLFGSVDFQIWTEMMAADDRLVATLTRWYLGRAPSGPQDLAEVGAAEEFDRLEVEAGEWGSLEWRRERGLRIERLKSAGAPTALALRAVAAFDLVHAPDIFEVTRSTGRSRIDVGRVFHRLGRALGLDDLEKVLTNLKLADPWQRWALENIEDDLLAVRRSLAERALTGAEGESVDEAVEQFLAQRADAVARVVEMARALESASVIDPAPLMVAVRQIQALAGS
jgi:NAD-specific glutamate dehydrogenase